MATDVTLPAAAFAGVLSFLSPCVLPLVPPYLCFITGTSLEDLVDNRMKPKEERRQVMLSALLFVLGFSTVFVALGASASWLGSMLRAELARQVTLFGFSFNPVTTVAGLIIIAMGLHFLGLFRMFWISREVRYQHKAHPGGLFGAYLIGLAFAFGWTPCIGPVLGTILTIAASEQDVTKGAGLLAVYSLGLGIPFLLAAAGVGTFMGFFANFRKHLGLVEKIAGALLVLSGIMFITGGVQAMSYWLIERFPVLLNLG